MTYLFQKYDAKVTNGVGPESYPVLQGAVEGDEQGVFASRVPVKKARITDP
jgi:hypothetical protein